MDRFTEKFSIHIIILGFLFAALIIPVAAQDWPQFQKDFHNSGITEDFAPIVAPNASDIWYYKSASVSDSGGIDVAPIVVGNSVYSISIDGTVSAVNKNDGSLIWKSKTIADPIPPLGTPAYGNGKIFVVPNKKEIYAFDAATGQKLWNKTVPTNIKIGNNYFNQLITPITYNDGKIYFGEWMGSNSFTQKYYCYDENGNLVWSRNSTSNNGYYWDGAAVIDNNLVYADTGGNLTSVDKNTGKTIEEFNVNDFFKFDSSSKMIRSSINYQKDSGKIYATTGSGYCFLIGYNSDGTFNKQVSASTQIGPSTSTPTVYKGRLYVGTGSVLEAPGYKTLYCLDANTLKEIWKYDVNGPIQSSPIISTAYDNGNGEVYIYFTSNSMDGRLYCLKDFDGNTNPILQWYYQPSDDKKQYILQGTAISDGRVFFANDAGYIFGIGKTHSSTNPNDNGTKPNDNGTKPNDNGTKPNDNGTKPNDTGTNPNDTGTNPNDTGTNPNDTGTKPNDTGTNPNDTGTKPNDNGTNPNDNGTNPNNNKPVDTGNTTTSTSALASGVCLKANITSSVCIEVSPDCVDFGTLSAGQISGNHQITIKNKGSKNAHMTAEVMDIAKNLYVDGLKLNSQTWKSFNTDVSSGQSSTVDVKLAVPSDYIGIGSMNGKVVFWAEMK